MMYENILHPIRFILAQFHPKNSMGSFFLKKNGHFKIKSEQKKHSW